ncbi:MAG: MarR family transcriptional regulator [Thermoplasmata archaeon]|jgi:DNA-binding MarR family transcriptional regulator|nr:MarR family transcriptional regulator [Thermoplasmata archaeon]
MSDDFDSMELPMKVLNVSRLMRLHRSEKTKDGMDPMAGQGRVLAFLKMTGEASSADMAMILGIRQQSLNQSLMRLEEEGYIVREQAEDDRRRIIVRLTEKGRGVEIQRNQVPKAFEELTGEEQEQLSAILDKLIDGISEELGLPDDPDERMEAVRMRMGEERFRRAMLFHGSGGMGDHRHHM